MGLLRPSLRSEGGFRLYTEDDIEKILVIRRMKPLGFTLDEMKAVMRDIEAVRGQVVSTDGAKRRLVEIQREAGERRARLVEQLAMADEFIDLLGVELS